jgi:GNAT superfamily N-acetyltransferase
VDNIEIRQADDGDRERVVALVSRMWAEDIKARFDWLYLSNPHGRALTWLAVERETGRAVGCTSIFPRRVLVEGRERLGSIGGDCYIEPHVRRRGLATALHRASLMGSRERGVDFMYGPPNPNNLAALVKAGSSVVTGFRRWVRPLAGRAVYRAAFARPPSKLGARIADLPVRVLDRLTRADRSGVTLERITEFGPEFDQLFARAAADREITCVRDSRYLTWRYLAAPSRRQTPFAVLKAGELVGLVALELMGEQAAIVDLFTPADPKLVDATLQLVLDHAAGAGCAGVEISCTPEAVVTRSLRRLGFIARSERGFQVAAHSQDSQLKTLLGANSWQFMVADQDMDTFFSGPPE